MNHHVIVRNREISVVGPVMVQSNVAVDTVTVSVGTTKTGEAGTEASVANSGTTSAAVLDFTIPRGEKGEKGDTGTGVPDGGTPGQLLSKTDSGTAWVDPPSTGNVPKRTVADLVAHGEDAYAQKPVEVRIKGKTVKNLWPSINASQQNDWTCTTDETGLMHVATTTTTTTTYFMGIINLVPGKSYTGRVSTNPPEGVKVRVQGTSGGSISVFGTFDADGCAFTIPSDATDLQYCVACENSQGETKQVDYKTRVMLVEGGTAPDCFVPTGLHSVEPKKMVTAGKNLLQRLGQALPYTANGVTFSDNGDGGIRISGTATTDVYFNFFGNEPNFAQKLPAGDYVISLGGRVEGVELICDYFHDAPNGSYVNWLQITGSNQEPSGTLTKVSYIRPFLHVTSGVTADTVIYPQLELGSTATAYEPPNIATTPLPEVELRSLPDGTCDELVIKSDGTATVVRRTQLSDDDVTALPEPTTEPQSPVTLPQLPAPTFNAYHDSQVPSDTSTKYARDINLVLANLESVQAAFLGGE